MQGAAWDEADLSHGLLACTDANAALAVKDEEEDGGSRRLVDRNNQFGSEGRVNGAQGKAQSAAIAKAIASICNAAMRVVGAAGTSELVVTVH
jgi:hypothetical protein